MSQTTEGSALSGDQHRVSRPPRRKTTMELRNRATGGVRRDERPPLHDVALGPMVYGGERYGKMSERIKRQQRRVADVDATANRLITPRLAGVVIGLLFMAGFIFYLQYQVTHRRSRDKRG